jgi:hypothetical protein
MAQEISLTSYILNKAKSEDQFVVIDSFDIVNTSIATDCEINHHQQVYVECANLKVEPLGDRSSVLNIATRM